MTLREALALRYKSPEWVYLQEVPNATGSHSRRRADGVAMNMWPSRGMEIVGIEMKVSRSDWLQERKNPEKAEAIFQFCDRWYLAISDPAIVQTGELPATWGLLVLRGTKLVELVEAPKLLPQPLTRGFAFAMIRQLAEHSPAKAELQDRYNAGHADGLEAGKHIAGHEERNAQTSLDALRRQVDAFEKASGIKITEYHGGEDLGAMVKAISRIVYGVGYRSTMNVLRRNAQVAREGADLITASADEIDAVLRLKEGASS